MMEGLGNFLAFIWYGFIVGLIVITIMGVYMIFIPTKIRSDKLITPRIELVVENNKIDTVFVYQKK